MGKISAFGDMNNGQNSYCLDIEKQSKEFELAIAKILGMPLSVQEGKPQSQPKVEIPEPYNDY